MFKEISTPDRKAGIVWADGYLRLPNSCWWTQMTGRERRESLIRRYYGTAGEAILSRYPEIAIADYLLREVNSLGGESQGAMAEPFFLNTVRARGSAEGSESIAREIVRRRAGTNRGPYYRALLLPYREATVGPGQKLSEAAELLPTGYERFAVRYKLGRAIGPELRMHNHKPLEESFEAEVGGLLDDLMKYADQGFPADVLAKRLDELGFEGGIKTADGYYYSLPAPRLGFNEAGS